MTIPRMLEAQHFLITGTTGAGKTQVINGMLRSIRKRGNRAVIADPAGGFYARFGKPGTVERAVAQLKQMSGQTVIFHTALALLNTTTGEAQIDVVPTEVRFRTLSDDEIVRYVEKERPLDCAGSAKSEGLGITLLDALSGDDPNALVGLPLIALARMLRNEGISLP